MEFVLLNQTPIFRGMGEEEIETALSCLRAERRSYAKGEVIFRAGSLVDRMGVVLSGGVCIEMDDLWGNRSILNYVEPGQLFAEAYACLPGEPLMVHVVAATATEVLLLKAADVLHTCDKNCAHHHVLAENLLSLMARKNMELSRRMFHIAPKTIREKVMSYLSFESMRQGKSTVSIPFDRQQLADYLGVDRSALSNELSKLRREGLLEVEKNRFRILSQGE